MAGAIYNNLKEQEQRDWYRKIALFGDKQTIPLNVINAVLLLGNLESRGFRPDAESGTGASGLFQYIEGRWTDITTGKNKWYDDTRKQLKAWGYELSKLKMDNSDDQLAVIYAEVASYTKEFRSATKPGGKRDTTYYKNAWEAYDNACKGLGKDCPTDPYQKYILFIQSAHHGPSKIQEVITGWKRQVLPNIKDNLDFLKSKRKEWKMKVSQDDTEAPTDKVAEATERDSDRMTPAEQPDGAYPIEDKKRNLLAGSGDEAETARRGGNSDRGIPDSWMADAGNVHSDASNNVLRSAFRAANEPMDVEKAPTGFLADPGSPLQRAMVALGVKSDDVHLTPMASDHEHETPNVFNIIRNNGTLDIVGSCAMIPGGCEMTAGDKKVVMYQLSGSDVNLERYAKNDEGDFELQGVTRFGTNDGITTRRPFVA